MPGLEIRVGPPVVVIHADDHFVVTDHDGTINPERQQGFFASDTRLISRYQLRINGVPPTLLNSAAVTAFGARYELTNPRLGFGDDRVPKNVLHLRLDRAVGRGVHEDYDLVNYHDADVDVTMEVVIESDFADLFDVKAGTAVKRGARETAWSGSGLETVYRNGAFERSVRVEIVSPTSEPHYADGRISFRVQLAPRERWHACVYWLPVLSGDAPIDVDRACPEHSCSDITGDRSPRRRQVARWRAQCARFDTSDTDVTATIDRAIDDLSDLRIHRHDVESVDGETPGSWTVAAGVPWFVTLFGRDSLVVALQTFAVAPAFALGMLRALVPLQGDGNDDWRDMQPGKIEHEIRHGELAALRMIPQVPYYGTHDATALYVLAAARSFRWHGDRPALEALRPHVEHALAWIDRYGDLDGDGLQEYRTRSGQGMYNQSWKDSGEAIVHADGSKPTLPIATCELQGYVVAAKRAWADVLDDVFGDRNGARRLRDEAARLAEAIESRFWWEAEGTYYLGLDGAKQPIESVASNAGHLLWARAVVPERAARVAERLAAPDMWSGWGVRTLSETHHSYNPFSYQRGAVWPHDNAMLVEGLVAYGHHAEAGRVARGIFDAANCFQGRRLPEVFAGLAREPGAFPAQYLGANTPQAWASGAPIQMISAFLGLEPQAEAGSLRVNACLPDWLTSLRVAGLGVGKETFTVIARRGRSGDTEVVVEPHGAG